MVVLDKLCWQSQVAKLVFAIRLHEEAACVSTNLRQHNLHVIQVNRVDLEAHSAVAPSREIGSDFSGKIFLRLRRVHLECNSRLVRSGNSLPSAPSEGPE